MIYENVTKIDDVKRKRLFEAIEWLDGFLNGQTYVAGGDSVSIADFFMSATVSQLLVNILPLYFILYLSKLNFCLCLVYWS